MQEGRLREAEARLQEYLGLRPRDWEAWVYARGVQQSLGEVQESEQSFRRCLELNPESVEAKEGLALIYGERDGDWGRCLAVLEECLKETTEAGVPECMSSVWRGRTIGGAIGPGERALRGPALGVYLDVEGIEESAELAGAECGIGIIQQALHHDAERARQHLCQAMRLSPESVYARRRARTSSSRWGREGGGARGAAVAVRTAFSATDLRQILAGYDLGRLTSFGPFTGGTVQTNLWVRTTQSKLAFRCYENRGPERALYEAELLQHLSRSGYPCPAPTPKRPRRAGRHMAREAVRDLHLPRGRAPGPARPGTARRAVGEGGRAAPHYEGVPAGSRGVPDALRDPVLPGAGDMRGEPVPRRPRPSCGGSRASWRRSSSPGLCPRASVTATSTPRTCSSETAGWSRCSTSTTRTTPTSPSISPTSWTTGCGHRDGSRVQQGARGPADPTTPASSAGRRGSTSMTCTSCRSSSTASGSSGRGEFPDFREKRKVDFLNAIGREGFGERCRWVAQPISTSGEPADASEGDGTAALLLYKLPRYRRRRACTRAAPSSRGGW